MDEKSHGVSESTQRRGRRSDWHTQALRDDSDIQKVDCQDKTPNQTDETTKDRFGFIHKERKQEFPWECRKEIHCKSPG